MLTLLLHCSSWSLASLSINCNVLVYFFVFQDDVKFLRRSEWFGQKVGIRPDELINALRQGYGRC